MAILDRLRNLRVSKALGVPSAVTGLSESVRRDTRRRREEAWPLEAVYNHLVVSISVKDRSNSVVVVVGVGVGVDN